MKPSEYYLQQCQQGVVKSDQEQLLVLHHIDLLYEELMSHYSKRSHWLSRFIPIKNIRGLYLWGSVGVGKTFLMDCFFSCLPITEKKRMHFHAFMQWIHHELKKHQGQKNPLQSIAKQLAQNTFVLCFDEFVVNDITDAMILARLLEALLAEKMILFFTSNTLPRDLYKKGLQRSLFLPAIALIEHNMNVVHITTTDDYRMRHLKEAGVFFTPHDAHAQQEMEIDFAMFSEDSVMKENMIIINDRSIRTVKQSTAVIWFNFISLCNSPRSQIDYLAIAKRFHTVFLSEIPVLSTCSKDQLILFIKLIDVLYDAHTRLIFSASTSIDAMFVDDTLAFEFKRTRSRLHEMQTALYFSKIRL